MVFGVGMYVPTPKTTTIPEDPIKTARTFSYYVVLSS